MSLSNAQRSDPVTRHTGGVSEWEGGRRQRVRWSAGLAMVVVAALGATSIWSLRGPDRLAVDNDESPVAGETEAVNVVVAEPLRSDERTYCPSTHPVGAYPDGSFHPVGYPVASTAQPDACYDSAEAAEAAGHRRAAPPAGTEVVQGIYLEPTRSPSAADCRALADVAGYAVPCPARLPVPADGPSCGVRMCAFSGPDGPRQDSGSRPVGIVIQHRSFVIPPEPPWLGAPRDVVVTAVQVAGTRPNGAVRPGGLRELVSCFPEADIRPRGRSVFRTCVDAKPWVPGFGGYPLERHTSAVWRRGDVVYAAGVKGAGLHVEALLTAIIDGITYVDPAS